MIVVVSRIINRKCMKRKFRRIEEDDSAVNVSADAVVRQTPTAVPVVCYDR